MEAELNSKYGINKVKFIKCDVASNELHAAFEEAVQLFGYLDVVINNAGIMNDSPQVYEKEITINVVSYSWIRVLVCILCLLVYFVSNITYQKTVFWSCAYVVHIFCQKFCKFYTWYLLISIIYFYKKKISRLFMNC